MKRTIVWIWIMLILLTACTTESVPSESEDDPADSGETVTLTVVYTNDEHG
jgi:hypothetical protein